MATVVAQWYLTADQVQVPYRARMLSDGELIVAEEDTDQYCRASRAVNLRFHPGQLMECKHENKYKFANIIAQWWFDPVQGTQMPYLVRSLGDNVLFVVSNDSDDDCREAVMVPRFGIGQLVSCQNGSQLGTVMKQLSYDSTRSDLVPYSVRTLLDGQLITLEQDT